MAATDAEIIGLIEEGKTQREIIAVLGCSAKRITKLRPLAKGSRVKSATANKAGGGIDGFRKMFDPAVRNLEKVSSFLQSDEFREKGWVYDSDLRDRLRVGAAEWIHMRQSHEDLLVEVRDPIRKGRKTVWCHPDIIDEARSIAQRI